MSVNSVAFKKSRLAWDAAAKKAPEDVIAAGKALSGNNPEAMKKVGVWATQLKSLNDKLGDQLDHVLTAKDDKARDTAAKGALSYVKQYQNFVDTTHLPPEVLKHLKSGLAELAKGLAG